MIMLLLIVIALILDWGLLGGLITRALSALLVLAILLGAVVLIIGAIL